jgi:acyl-CoA synthetase (AMP-forming)/AMP-acid ligase II
LNIAERLRESAEKTPHQKAVVVATGFDATGKTRYASLTFQELDRESDRLARGLIEMGVAPGTRLVLMVRPGLEFVVLTFALFKSGAVIVLIDPGMGRSNTFRCLQEVVPEGFVAIPLVHVIRKLKSRLFPRARFNVTVGRRWFWGGPTYQKLRGDNWTPFKMPETRPTDPAAIIFTSGSTGPPKGVLYEHGMFNAQVDLLRDFYDIQPGEVDLSCFPLFALFNAGMGVTTVIPEMNPTKPAQADPEKIIAAIQDQHATQAYGSPALWNRIGRYAERHDTQFPTLKRALSAGAPVPIHVLERMRKTFQNGEADIHTPYGATESLPICSISGRDVLEKTAAQTRTGAGTCVGHRFPQIKLKIVEITSGPIRSLKDVRELPKGEIGEIIVQGPSTTREYFRRPEATANAKIPDGESFWHRMGDVGYLDNEDLLWFCGRKAHIVETGQGRMFTIPCEAIFNEHPEVYRCALVGVGAKLNQKPVIIVEPEEGDYPKSETDEKRFRTELRELAVANSLTQSIETFLFLRSLPVDTRHNVKIQREKLAHWADKKVTSNE